MFSDNYASQKQSNGSLLGMEAERFLYLGGFSPSATRVVFIFWICGGIGVGELDGRSVRGRVIMMIQWDDFQKIYCIINIMKNITPPKPQNLKLKEKSEMVTSVTHASQRSYKLAHTQMVKYLNLDYFKLHPCNNPKTHAHKHCVYYHNAKDRKRFGNFYSDIMCKHIMIGQKCPLGEQCPEAHSRVQQLYQFQTYKKKFCSHYPGNIEKCQYGDYCSFAHSQSEIRINLIHNYVFDEDFYMFLYKTQFCPFNLTEHDKALCVYAHNWQDYRRSPSYYSYQPLPCYNWRVKEYIYDYESGCDNGQNCNMCHGWKELQYHPNYYRTTKCLQSQCRRGECPNYHSDKEKRIIDEDVENNCFHYVGRNRIVEGVFKPELQDSFIPKEETRSKSLIQCPQELSTDTDFKIKTTFKGKVKYVEKEKTSDERQRSKDERYFLDQSPAESEEESGSDNSEVINQVDRLMFDE